MEQFIGCDAHKKFSVFVAVNEKGQAGEALRVAHDRELYREFLARLPPHSTIAVEAQKNPALALDWGHHSPRSDDAFFQTFLLPLLIKFFIVFSFRISDLIVFFVLAVDFAALFGCPWDSACALSPKPTFKAAFAPTLTLTLASPLIVTGESMPPTKLATGPSITIVFAKLE
jgi:hypothetical protein